MYATRKREFSQVRKALIDGLPFRYHWCRNSNGRSRRFCHQQTQCHIHRRILGWPHLDPSPTVNEDQSKPSYRSYCCQPRAHYRRHPRIALRLQRLSVHRILPTRRCRLIGNRERLTFCRWSKDDDMIVQILAVLDDFQGGIIGRLVGDLESTL